MSLARILAMMARRRATFLGWTTHGEGASNIDLPSGSAVGDYCVINNYASYVVGGGAGVAWTNFLFNESRVSHRLLQAGDLSTPLTLNGDAPVIVGVWRGPVGMSAQKSAVSWTVEDPGIATPVYIPGFTKSSAALAIYGVGNGDQNSVDFKRKVDGGLFDSRAFETTIDNGYGSGSLTEIDGYVNGTDLLISAGGPDYGTGAVAAVYELI